MNGVHQNTILIQCEDAKGLIHTITDIIVQNDLNIIVNREFVEHDSQHFFMRTVVEGELQEDRLLAQLRNALPDDADIRLSSRQTKRVVIMATKEHHVLGDLLIRNEFQTLNAEVKAVVSNHEDLGPLVKKFQIPFHYISHQDLEREEHESAILNCLSEYDPDYILLAKYMRILSPDFVRCYENKLINIHHSFLPAFVGARPYHQAFERGVKIIGATAHFVTNDLDEGPIISQKTRNVDHRYSAEQMALAGQEVESQVMAEAAGLVLRDQVFIYGNKTVILD